MNQSTSSAALKRQATTRLLNFAAILGISISLTGCGASKPGTDDIAQFVQERIAHICPRWDISDIRKVDGMQQGEMYRIDFAAKMTVNAEKAKAPPDAMYASCITGLQQGGLVYDPNAEGGIKATKLDVNGWGLLTKSEKGWRLMTDEASPMAPFADLHLTFVPGTGS